ncbi:hypothetical protein DEIGR_103015 [Deinococcus grandis]|uniref:Uncharacterized protein n=1 Tax=Deinococcus grandis TaxID=57498 RepID=A0A100HLP3_9DEIO|nr:hypothetical protein [Deinococcus grandis]BBN93501.1 hypothetical protein DEGR_02340 [Deinococcus grandis]GAQ22988.1 hypothetical protein DEIGR_103015 [Deinococcus grandis]
MHRAILTTALAATLASTASAQTLSVNINASLQYPSVIQTTANVINLLNQGVRVTFLTPTNQQAATLGTSGGIVVNPAYPTTRLTQVQVMTQVPGTTTYAKEIYPLAQPISTAQPLSAQSIIVKAKDGTRQPLVNVMGRQAAWAKAPGLQKKPGGMPPGQYKKTQGNK